MTPPKDWQPPRLRLIGRNANAFSVLGAAQRCLRDNGATEEQIRAYMDEATAGDYNHLLATTMNWFEVE